MSLFKSKEKEKLQEEIEKLHEEKLDLVREKCALQITLTRCYRRELVDKIADELNLTDLQKSKLAFIFSIEHCRLAGVPDDQILHSMEEIDKFFTSEESA